MGFRSFSVTRVSWKGAGSAMVSEGDRDGRDAVESMVMVKSGLFYYNSWFL